MSSRPPLVRLDDELATDAALCGAKAASLAALARWTDEVRPRLLPGVVLTVASGALEASLGHVLRDCVAALGNAPGGYAVRSSSPVEDGMETSMAGRFHTELSVALDDVAAASARVLAASSRLDPTTPMAVLIQPMVAAELYGVVLVDRSVDDEPRFVVELAPGADAVTAGRGTPLRWSTDEAGSTELPHGAAAAAQWARAAGDRLGHGVDVEIAVHDDGFTVLQLRPLTAPLMRAATPAPGGDPAGTEQVVLHGHAVGTGRVTGTVVKVASADELAAADDLPHDAVLVTATTDPSYVPFLSYFRAVVTEQGGVASHAAIVCRELGILAVVGCVGATSAFASGDAVELVTQGSGGIVSRPASA